MFQLLNGLKKNRQDYQSIPFWSWNDKLEEDVLLEQINWMQEKGNGGFFMHARAGLRTSYMSEEWMQCVNACVEAAKKRGMQAWIYDENGWPSGFAGGKLLEKEENRDTYLTYTIGEYDASAWLTYSMEDVKLRRITKYISGECLNVFLHISPSTVDILNAEVVEQFLEETHEKYAKRFGECFSKCLTGIFTDEPQYYRWETAYTRVLPEAYEELYGEDLLENLGLLFVEKEGYRAFRYRYWYTMQKLMLKNYAEKIYCWCEDHGIKFTGHYIEEQSLGYQMLCCGGVMPFYEYLHMPGIDWLGRSVGNKIPLRQVASVAQQLGKKQILSETYGCCGWDVTPAELKRIGDFQYVGGVNRTCQHLIPYSERGRRKRDYPSHFSRMNPWVNSYFKEFNDYFTKLGYLLANAKEVVNVAMLHPIRSAYFDYKDNGEDGRPSIYKLEEAFYEQQQRLSQEQIPFHFLDETLLERHGFVNDNRIGCGLCEYEYLVIPTCYTMGCHTEKLIRKYVENGGKVLLLDDKPAYLEGEPYEYPYLISNITYQQLSESLPYRLKGVVEGVHSTLRQTKEQTEKQSFLFVQNYSEEEKTIIYELTDGYTSFEQWDLATMTYKIISTEVTLKPNQSCILMFCNKEPEKVVRKEILHLSQEAEVTAVTENYLTLDTLQYSKDGSTYSEELPYIGAFRLLLEERYEGTLYIKYSFKLKTKPEQISLITEKCEGSSLSVNGQEIELNETWERDSQFLRGDIAPFVILGQNEIVCKMNFYQGENVYYALFGENVTEGLLNCLSYDTEIEPIYLAGQFGVFAEKMEAGQEQNTLLCSDFYIGKQLQKVCNLITDGYPFFSGNITLRRTVEMQHTDVVLEFKGRFHAMKVWVNGSEAGSLLFENQLDISEFTQKGTNEIVIELIVSNRNMYGPHHMVSDEEPMFVGPHSFELPDSWVAGRSIEYRDSYAFVLVPIH